MSAPHSIHLPVLRLAIEANSSTDNLTIADESGSSPGALFKRHPENAVSMHGLASSICPNPKVLSDY